MTEGQKPKTKGNYINGWSLISLTTSAIFILCCWGWRCRKRWECRMKETDEIVVQDATVVEEAGSRKASAPPAPPALAAAPEPRTYSGRYTVTVESERA